MATELTPEQAEELESKGSIQLSDGSLLVRAIGQVPEPPVLITLRLRHADRYRLVYALVYEGQLVDQPAQILCSDPGELDSAVAAAARLVQKEVTADFEHLDLDLVADVDRASQRAALYGLRHILEFLQDPVNTPDG
jgi:hypothetical protein